MWFPLLLIFMLVVLTLTIIMMILGRVISPKLPDLEKKAPYECGFDPMKSPRLPFSFRFFLVAMLFLIFDLEMALLLVTPISLSLIKPSYSATILLGFMMMLTVGLYYEWVKGGLDWAEE